MGEDLIEFLSEWNKIGKNIENMVRDVIHNENIPLLIRADLLLRSGIGKKVCEGIEPDSITELLEDMSDPDISWQDLESCYAYLEWFIDEEIIEIVENEQLSKYIRESPR